MKGQRKESLLCSFYCFLSLCFVVASFWVFFFFFWYFRCSLLYSLNLHHIKSILMRVTLNAFILPWLCLCNIHKHTLVCIKRPKKNSVWWSSDGTNSKGERKLRGWKQSTCYLDLGPVLFADVFIKLLSTLYFFLSLSVMYLCITYWVWKSVSAFLYWWVAFLTVFTLA